VTYLEGRDSPLRLFACHSTFRVLWMDHSLEVSAFCREHYKITSRMNLPEFLESTRDAVRPHADSQSENVPQSSPRC
jgi:hypothetical protein